MEWLQIGSLADTTVEQARKQALKILGQFAEGKNPAQIRRQEKAEMTLGDARWQAIMGSSLPIVGRSLGRKNPSATAIYARLHMDPVRASVEAATSRMLTAGGRKEVRKK